MPRTAMISDEAVGWQARAGDFALSCAGSFASDEATRLGEFVALLRACPPCLLRGLNVPDVDRTETLLAVGATTSLATELFERADIGYLLSRGGHGSAHLASVVLPNALEEISASGDTAALALICALALAMAEAAVEPIAMAERRAPDGLRFN